MSVTDNTDPGTTASASDFDFDISVRLVPAYRPAYVSVTVDDAWRLRERIRRLNRKVTP